MKTLRCPSEFLDRMEVILTSRLEKYFLNKIDYNPQTVKNVLQRLGEILKHDVDWSGIEEIEKDVMRRMYSLEKIALFLRNTMET